MWNVHTIMYQIIFYNIEKLNLNLKGTLSMLDQILDHFEFCAHMYEIKRIGGF